MSARPTDLEVFFNKPCKSSGDVDSVLDSNARADLGKLVPQEEELGKKESLQ
jgi:hypothetical protein